MSWLSWQDSRERVYILIAFSAGVLLTLGYKDIYPDLERRFRRGVLRRRSRIDIDTHDVLSDADPDIVLEDNTTFAHSVYDRKRDPDLPSKPYHIKTGIEGTIGNTPLIKIKSLSDATGCEILAKAEFLNGAGNSPKDRVALNMLRTAEEQGLLVPHRGDVVYEGTVGSTGISLAAICRARGYLAHICMPNDQSAEKSSLLLKLGARVERVPPASIVDSKQFVNLARARAAEHTADTTRPGRGYFADQFENPANHLAHLQTTGPEIYAQCDGKLDAFVAGAGTGGTISGVAMFLKPRVSNLKVVLADPTGSGLLNKIKHGVMFADTEREGTRRRQQVDSIVEGVGINRITANFEAGMDLLDDAIRVNDQQAMRMARWLVERDGIFAGSSTAVNCTAAVKLANKLGPGHRIVTILCDSGTRHLSKFWAAAGDIGGSDEMTLESVVAD